MHQHAMCLLSTRMVLLFIVDVVIKSLELFCQCIHQLQHSPCNGILRFDPVTQRGLITITMDEMVGLVEHLPMMG